MDTRSVCIPVSSKFPRYDEPPRDGDNQITCNPISSNRAIAFGKLAAIFGIPHEVVEHRCIWHVFLLSKDHEDSFVEFLDHKDAVRMTFHGCEKMAAQASSLVYCLLLTPAPRPYDYVWARSWDSWEYS